MKTCNKCKKEKDLSKFNKDKFKKDGHSGICKECNKITCKAYYSTHKEQVKEYWDKKFKEDPKLRRSFKLKQFNLTLQDVDIMIEIQENKCLICKEIFTEKNYPVVDHDHACCPEAYRSCGKCIRGLLCGLCNMSIGGFRDNPVLCRAAADYLEIHKNLLTTESVCSTVNLVVKGEYVKEV